MTLRSAHAKKALGIALIGAAVYLSRRRWAKKPVPRTEPEESKPELSQIAVPGRKKRVSVDREFLERLKTLLRIVLPSWKSKEALVLYLHSAALVARTFLTIAVTELDGAMTKSLVDRQGRLFLFHIALWLGVALPATYVNSMIRFLESKLALAFRTRLVQHAYDGYMADETYYRVGTLDRRLGDPDQCLTEDINSFCNNLAHLYSSLSKPLLDVVLMTYQLLRKAKEKAGGSYWAGFVPTVMAVVSISATAKALRWLTPPFGKMAAQQMVLEGDLRAAHSRLIANAEEIAFYQGHAIAKAQLERRYYALVKHLNGVYHKRIFYYMMESFFLKYVWSTCGLLMIAWPVFFGKGEIVTASASRRTQDFVTSKGLLAGAADALQRIMSAYKDIEELAGYTQRVADMVRVFAEVRRGQFERPFGIAPREFEIAAAHGKPLEVPPPQVAEGDAIFIQNVPLVTPTGDLLIRSLNMEVKPGEHLLITGPNGCGKSSLFRILGGLWPLVGGTVVRPQRGSLFYIPQRPYLTPGSLKEQLIYPDTLEDMRRRGVSDEQLGEIVALVNLTHVVTRVGGWDVVRDWTDVLSGGEKQRVGFARVFYHKPRFAILDECTSAVSIDVEGRMYEAAAAQQITLLSVSHRPSLWKYHQFLLQFDGHGAYTFARMEASTLESLREERERLAKQLSEVHRMQERLEELDGILGTGDEPEDASPRAR